MVDHSLQMEIEKINPRREDPSHSPTVWKSCLLENSNLLKYGLLITELISLDFTNQATGYPDPDNRTRQPGLVSHGLTHGNPKGHSHHSPHQTRSSDNFNMREVHQTTQPTVACQMRPLGPVQTGPNPTYLKNFGYDEMQKEEFTINQTNPPHDIGATNKGLVVSTEEN
ncbi:hypothetical protein U1Q18_035933 [Sarracenia purpurea var. burkii]